MSSHLAIGSPAPEFDLPVIDPANPAEGQRAKLSNYAGKYLVLYFYPRDNTPGCTTQALSFSEHLAKFDAANAQILGVSADSLASHAKFVGKKNLAIPLGSDESRDVCRAYGVWVEKKMYGKTFMGIQRSTFLISPAGKILHIWRKVKVKDHIEQVLAELGST
jgi:peroxiredoxin Q/BCP